ncbi:MAG TPA: SH3 domain-containing protein [Sphingomicrobium sp.]|nr:SH3 domain-containing protein [Sphingomicrobium sp.]
MKNSSATSARATEPPRPTGRSSARPPSPTSANVFDLSGPSDLPDPDHHAYRKDLADVALAGRVIASHYAEPLPRRLARNEPLRRGPSEADHAVRALDAGDLFEMLDDSAGWAWGYAGPDRFVGYVRSEGLEPA